MWNPFNRREKSRRNEDIKDRLEKAIDDKHKASLEALEKLRQFSFERRFHVLPVDLERRRA